MGRLVLVSTLILQYIELLLFNVQGDLPSILLTELTDLAYSILT